MRRMAEVLDYFMGFLLAASVVNDCYHVTIKLGLPFCSYSIGPLITVTQQSIHCGVISKFYNIIDHICQQGNV